MTSRTAASTLGLTLASLALLAPARARGQGSEPQRCVLQFESSSGARSTLNKLPSGQYNAYQGGGVT